MHIRVKVIIGFLFLLVVLSGVNYFYKPLYGFFDKKLEVSQSNEKEIEELLIPELTQDPIKTMFVDMTTAEKIGQLIAAPLDIDYLEDEDIEWLSSNDIGLVVIFGNKIARDDLENSLKKIRDSYNNRTYQPLFAVDHEGGVVQRLNGEGFTVLPSWKEACNSEQTKLEESYKSSAKELASSGINIVLAPVLDITKDNQILDDRACELARQAFSTSSIYIDAFGKHGIMPVVKHFPGIGGAEVDLHDKFTTIDFSKTEGDLFKEVLDNYPTIGLMTSHVGIKDYFETSPCSQSKECLNNLEENYPEVLVFSDDLNMESAKGSEDEVSLAQRAQRAVSAGNDIVIFGKGVGKDDLNDVIDQLVNSYEMDRDFQEQVDNSLYNVLKLKNSQVEE